jgi:hypothetical protein
VAAFASQCHYLNGTAIPAADWTNRIPKKIHPLPARWRQQFDFDVDLDPPGLGVGRDAPGSRDSA